ncbi:putative disease resistance protein RGA4 isoform X1 [Triticum urartu]|uniref:putative disease resistance protein RGA4 isoform X1 n=1 Tax=Triticum urartu TaxID=4572 RepID=UPI0020431571|nr:putative disease resistance protein RGA4 isoform X1 [Triticum urartu]XP_048547313.1 putative disease resistance protein RGA4 isoform X1 [Triticum urartu]XP_048547314.1 putative disease resistance protein RGA4 isoform X1 [Triticum urartu]XP_048547315.1 putative disease resistance protein RGA4 isoform X1 [Triticum urartu]XP_048547316.1 putative disease resistance protein RGA4 isoform X1 [Triticum urartu]
MAAVVATMVVGPLVKIVMEKASGSLLDQYKVMEGMEEQRDILERRLLAISDVITDAEEVASHRAGAKAWLEKVKNEVYLANEVFDELKYEALRREAQNKGHYKELGFNVVKLFPTHNRFVFRNTMGRKLRKVVRSFEVLVDEMNKFDFRRHQPPPVSNQWRQNDQDIFDPKKIISRSRAKDNKKIVDILVGQANNTDLTVVPIVGMGGLGKTTLAQLVYNDPAIQKHFDVLIWVCVSDSFDVISLAKSIVEAALEKHYGEEAVTSKKKKKTPLDSLQNVVSGQRYLLVLDDVWTREVHKWEQLRACLEHGGMGSVVLTTTRDEGVAEIMGTIEAYNLGALGAQYIEEIIKTIAFSRFKKEEERPAVLVSMVGEIVERCAGSPLAAVVLGSVLRTKTSEEEWKAISSKSNICAMESGILSILKLSYNDLPQYMKQCFAFCAIFPKDYEIDVEKLIQLWIAHGFLVEEKLVRPETIGKQIFSELASRSFFQDVKPVQATVKEMGDPGSCYCRTTCKIHDLMHDVALSVMDKECALATEEPSQSEWLRNTARHLFLSCKDPERKLNSSLQKCSPAIHTLLCDDYMGSSLQQLSRYSSLQALKLCLGLSFPLKLKHLHHLRYLDLSGSRIEALPEDMSILYSLQTLNISVCKYLGELPRQLKYMTSLRHLYTHGCPQLKGVPRDLGNLTSLQTFTCFVVGSGSHCSNVGELRNLNLGGQLQLHNVENMTEEDAIAANLVNKKELRELTLRWSTGENDARVLLQNLKPHDGLYAIRIHNYGSTTFPAWMVMLQNIVEIHLFCCHKLQWLFSRDRDTSFAFPSLKQLTLKNLSCLERWWEIDNDGMQGEEIMFPLLEKLFILNCERFTALPGQPTFPNLQDVYIKKCPLLATTAKSPKLSVLTVEGNEAELFMWVARHTTSLTKLKLQSLEESTETTSAAVERCLREVGNNKEKWNGHDFPLALLVLKNLKSGVTELCACFVHLQDLSILRSRALVHWPEKEFQGLVSLRKLVIDRCNNLTGYEHAPAESSTSSGRRQLLPRLESLTITNCSSLVEVFNIPASLRRMDISGCGVLASIYGRRLKQGELRIHQGPSSIQEVLSSSSPGAWAEHLEELTLRYCHSLTGVLHLPQSLKHLRIRGCGGLTSLESRSGELPSLEFLELVGCNTLLSIADGPQVYSSLQYLGIRGCPGMKTLPTSLQQQLGSMQEEYIDAHDYGNTRRPTLLKPKTWKYAIRKD